MRQSRHDHNAYRGLETFAIRLFWPQKCCLSGQSISVDLNSSQEEHVVNLKNYQKSLTCDLCHVSTVLKTLQVLLLFISRGIIYF